MHKIIVVYNNNLVTRIRTHLAKQAFITTSHQISITQEQHKQITISKITSLSPFLSFLLIRVNLSSHRFKQGLHSRPPVAFFPLLQINICQCPWSIMAPSYKLDLVRNLRGKSHLWTQSQLKC